MHEIIQPRRNENITGIEGSSRRSERNKKLPVIEEKTQRELID
jgi:hypothetical protein